MKTKTNQMKIRIAEIQEPGEGRIRVQEVHHGFRYDILNKDIFYDNSEDDIGPKEIDILFKEYFNKQFSTPKPVTCKECSDSDNKEPEGCASCVYDGIESYICWVYDNETKDNLILKIYGKEEHDSLEYKRKPFQIIINPYSLIYNIGAENKNE